jgi:hypothetical protein
MNEDEIRTALFYLRKKMNLATGMNLMALEADELDLLAMLKEFTDERIA